jgi:hypothetical protein
MRLSLIGSKKARTDRRGLTGRSAARMLQGATEVFSATPWKGNVLGKMQHELLGG